MISINPYLLGMIFQVWWNPCCQLGEVELHLSSVVEGFGWMFVDIWDELEVFFWLKCMEMLQHSLQACRWNVVFMTLCQCFCMNLFLGTRIKLVESFFVGLNFSVPFFGRSVFCATEILLSSGLIVDYLHTMPGTARVKAWWQPCVLWCIKIYQSSNSAWLI